LQTFLLIDAHLHSAAKSGAVKITMSDAPHPPSDLAKNGGISAREIPLQNLSVS